MFIVSTKKEIKMVYTNIEDATGSVNPSDMDARVDGIMLRTESTGRASFIESINQNIKRFGYMLVPSPADKNNGFTVYVKKTPTVPGLRMGKVQVWLRGDKTDVNHCYKRIAGWYSQNLAELGEDAEENDGAIKALKSFYGLLTACQQIRNPLINLSNMMIAQGLGVDEVMSRRNMGWSRDVTTRILPSAETVVEFPDLDPRELLHVFPEAEQTFLMWSIGRIMCGRKGSERINRSGKVKKNTTEWRGWVLLQSDAGGIGKSTFCKTLLNHLAEFGYSQASINVGGRFDWLQTATADIAYKDDFNNKEQGVFIRDENVKIIASSGTMSTEGKGETRVDNIQTEAFILGCTNTANQAHFFGVDDGTLTRSNILSAKTSTELGEDDNIIKKWNEVAFRVGTQVPIEPGQVDEDGEPIPTNQDMCPTLMTWFIGQCVTKYLLDQPDMDIQAPVRAQFRTKSAVTSSSEISLGYMQCIAASARYYERMEGEALSEEMRLEYFDRMIKSFSTKKVLAVLNIAATTGAISLPSLNIGIMKSFQGTTLADKIQSYGEDNKTSSTRLFNDLKTIDGNSYTTYEAQYIRGLELPKIVQLYDEMTSEMMKGFSLFKGGSQLSDAFSVVNQ
jgi:hypothetical protein